jgi:hypothetical protein
MVLWDKVAPPTREEVEGAVPEHRAWEGVLLHMSAQLQSAAEGQGEMEKIPPEMVMVRRAVLPAEVVVEPEDPQLDPKPWEERVERDRLF